MNKYISFLVLSVFFNYGCVSLTKIENHPDYSEIYFQAKKSVITTYTNTDLDLFKESVINDYEFYDLGIFKYDKKPGNIYVCGKIAMRRDKYNLRFKSPLLINSSTKRGRQYFISHSFIFLKNKGSCITNPKGSYDYANHELKCDGTFFKNEINLSEEITGCPIF